MKKFLSFILGFTAAVLVLSAVVPVFALYANEKRLVQYNDIDIILDGKPVVLADAEGKAVEPFIIDGTTYLPVRALAAALGLEVDWNNDTTTVILTEKSGESPGASKPEGEGAPPPEGLTESSVVFIAPEGGIYHLDSLCGGSVHFATTLRQALEAGMAPCDICVK